MIRTGKWGTGSTGGMGVIAIVGAMLVLPASASAIKDVIVTPDPLSKKVPGGTFTFNLQITGALPGASVYSLTDNVYGNLHGQGTCSLPQPLPYSCQFPGAFFGPHGSTQTNTVLAVGLEIIDTPGGPSPETSAASGSTTVAIRGCRKGRKLEKVKGKKKCVKRTDEKKGDGGKD